MVHHQRETNQLDTTVGSIGFNMGLHPIGTISTPCRVQALTSGGCFWGRKGRNSIFMFVHWPPDNVHMSWLSVRGGSKSLLFVLQVSSHKVRFSCWDPCRIGWVKSKSCVLRASRVARQVKKYIFSCNDLFNYIYWGYQTALFFILSLTYFDYVIIHFNKTFQMQVND
jgi:hypothetical protein